LGLFNQAIIILEKLIQKNKYSKKCLNSFHGVGGKKVEEYRNRNSLHLRKVVFKMVVFAKSFPENKKEV